nr:hypothetical protein GCM10020093_099620 [Planobispora longispora]
MQETATVQAPAAPRNAWSSPADAGWQAARAVQDPSMGGVTGAGLPKRVPKANLVPGSAAPGAAPSAPVAPRPSVSPDAVRNRLASFQRGSGRGGPSPEANPTKDRRIPPLAGALKEMRRTGERTHHHGRGG